VCNGLEMPLALDNAQSTSLVLNCGNIKTIANCILMRGAMSVVSL